MSEQELELTNLARAINAEHENCNIAIFDGLQHALKAGELLHYAKALVNHGEWIQWVENNCSFKERTAQNYMRIYTRRNELPEKTQDLAGLTYYKAIDLLAEPQEKKSNKTALVEYSHNGSFSWLKDDRIVQMHDAYKKINFAIETLSKPEHDKGTAFQLLKQARTYHTDFVEKIDKALAKYTTGGNHDS